jgi:hypothetical protein
MRITYVIENTGDVAVKATRSATVSSSVGPSPAPVAADDMPLLEPGERRTLTQDVSGVWPGFGTTTEVVVEPYVPSDPDLDLEEAAATARTSNTLLPVPQGLLLALLVAAAGVGTFLLVRRHRAASAAAAAAGPGPSDFDGMGRPPTPPPYPG